MVDLSWSPIGGWGQGQSNSMFQDMPMPQNASGIPQASPGLNAVQVGGVYGAPTVASQYQDVQPANGGVYTQGQAQAAHDPFRQNFGTNSLANMGQYMGGGVHQFVQQYAPLAAMGSPFAAQQGQGNSMMWNPQQYNAGNFGLSF